MMMILPAKPAIISFPASNCAQDMQRALREVYEIDAPIIWHQQESIPLDVTHLILPGGFSFGDYVRAGALAAMSPIMKIVSKMAVAGMPILGVCNGFQILCEARLLPGVLLKNHHDRFVCKQLPVTWYGTKTRSAYSMHLPIAHREGRYFVDGETLAELEHNQQIILRYNECDQNGNALVNGSRAGIAGIVGGPARNILGMMPHPERAANNYGSCGIDGRVILDDFLRMHHEKDS